MKKLPRFNHLTVGMLLIGISAGCNQYYKALQVPTENNTAIANSIKAFRIENKDFILRNGKLGYQMKNITIMPDATVIETRLDSIAPQHQLHLSNGRRGKFQYDKDIPEDLAVLNEVHLYLSGDTTIINGLATIPLNKIKKIELIQKDKSRTRNSQIAGAGASVLIVGALVGGIIGLLFAGFL